MHSCENANTEWPMARGREKEKADKRVLFLAQCLLCKQQTLLSSMQLISLHSTSRWIPDYYFYCKYGLVVLVSLFVSPSFLRPLPFFSAWKSIYLIIKFIFNRISVFSDRISSVILFVTFACTRNVQSI